MSRKKTALLKPYYNWQFDPTTLPEMVLDWLMVHINSYIGLPLRIHTYSKWSEQVFKLKKFPLFVFPLERALAMSKVNLNIYFVLLYCALWD